MSELTNFRDNRASMLQQWLATASALTLLTYGVSAKADEANRPTVWIELGGQLERLNNQGDAFDPSFLAANSDISVFSPVSPSQASKPPSYTYGVEGKISLQPSGSDWVFSAGARYGRSNNNKFLHEQSFMPIPPPYLTRAAGAFTNEWVAIYAETTAAHEESHLIADFTAGRDVGIGLFGRHSDSVFALGVRFAQLDTSEDAKIKVRPDIRLYAPANKYWRNYVFKGDMDRSFHGVGPTVSWDSSVSLIGSPDESEISLDFGMNGALLFGRQRVSGSHHTTGRKFGQKYNERGPHTTYVNNHYVTRYKSGGPVGRSKSVTIPNVGGFAGLSFHYAAAKVGFGYRADFFFGAIDGGIDTRKSEDVGFHGPFATISIGL